MRLRDHFWMGVLVSLGMGSFMIAGGAYLWAFNGQAGRERERAWNERLTGVKIPPPPPQQAARDWDRDMLTGAAVGGAIWLAGVVTIFSGARKNRRGAAPAGGERRAGKGDSPGQAE